MVLLLLWAAFAVLLISCNSVSDYEATKVGDSNEASRNFSDQSFLEASEPLDFVIVDYRATCGAVWDEALDEFFQDEDYIYYFGERPHSAYIIVEYSDGTTQNVKEALEDGNITIADLDRFDIKYFKNPIEE